MSAQADLSNDAEIKNKIVDDSDHSDIAENEPLTPQDLEVDGQSDNQFNPQEPTMVLQNCHPLQVNIDQILNGKLCLETLEFGENACTSTFCDFHHSISGK